MIKTGILGAETADAGELIRVLINHPDVELTTLASEPLAGSRVVDHHRGLEGDCDLLFSESLSADGHDAVFLCGEAWQAKKWVKDNAETLTESETRLIDLTGAYRDSSDEMVYGLAEFNRKPLVRGAMRATTPSPVAMAVGLSLFPLAKNHLLDSDIHAEITLARPSASATDYHIGESTRFDPIAPRENRPDLNAAAKEIEHLIKSIQPSFNNKVFLTFGTESTHSRGLKVKVETAGNTPLNELKRIYEEAYHDHNFTYVIDREPMIADVGNTNKCLLYLDYPQAQRIDTRMPALRITAAIDNLLKGGAGNAVHCMNLLFGLSERTGLNLKASVI